MIGRNNRHKPSAAIVGLACGIAGGLLGGLLAHLLLMLCQ